MARWWPHRLDRGEQATPGPGPNAPPLFREKLMRRAALVLLVTLAGGIAWAQPMSPGKTRDVLTGDAKGSAAANPQCRMFSPAEIAGYLGTSVGPGKNAAGGAGCQWTAKTDEADAILTIVPARHYEEPSLVKGFKRLPGLGKKAWVAPDAGWRAGVLLDDVAILVSLEGGKANEANVVAFLREALKRRN
jgi:hypothetical protein